MNMLGCLDTPTDGRYDFNGKNVAHMVDDELAEIRNREIGFVFQTFNLLQGFTCLENVLLGMSFGPGADRGRARGLLERVGLGDRLDYFPRQLSTGKQQRVAVARRPKVAGGEGYELRYFARKHGLTTAQAMDLIRRLCSEQGSALLLVSHDRSVLDSFPRCESLARLNRASRTEVRP